MWSQKIIKNIYPPLRKVEPKNNKKYISTFKKGGAKNMNFKRYNQNSLLHFS
jgi:hypothetical protein